MTAFLVVASLLLVPAALLSLYLYPVDGDLVRVGFLAQRDFTAQAPAPALLREAGSRAAPDADILVLGDSFAARNAWQSELARLTGRRVATWHFDAVRCTPDWIDKAIAGALVAGARTVIVESVEREFLDRFEGDAQCAKDHYPQAEPEVGPLPGQRSQWAIFPMDIRHLAKSAVRFRDARHAGRYRSGKTVVVDLVRDDLFSHPLPARLAYFNQDEHKFEHWDETRARATVARLAAWRADAASRGVDLHFLLIPDKSSVYWPYIVPAQQLPYPQNGEGLHALVAGAQSAQHDMLVYLRAQVLVHKDVYRPDDTHFGAAGYRLTAARVAAWLR